MPLIALLTDFGTRDSYVGAMKGVIKNLSPRSNIVDVTHDIAPQHIAEARFVLWSAHAFFPADSIFVCVVDPGVGTSRRILGLRTDKYLFLVPDNGLADLLLAETEAREIVSVTNRQYFLQTNSPTFHGRDIFAPVAAHLANGVPFASIGEPLTLPVPPTPIVNISGHGHFASEVLYIDRFGNMITGLRAAARTNLKVIFKGSEMSLRVTYGDVRPGEPLALVGSHGLIEIAVRNGSAQQLFNGAYGMKVEAVA